MAWYLIWFHLQYAITFFSGNWKSGPRNLQPTIARYLSQFMKYSIVEKKILSAILYFDQ